MIQILGRVFTQLTICFKKKQNQDKQRRITLQKGKKRQSNSKQSLTAPLPPKQWHHRVGKFLHVPSYLSLTSEVSGNVWVHRAILMWKQSRNSLNNFFTPDSSSQRFHAHTHTTHTQCIYARTKYTSIGCVKVMKLEDTKEACARLVQHRKEMEHTSGSEQEAARKRGLGQDVHSHIRGIGALWAWALFSHTVNV